MTGNGPYSHWSDDRVPSIDGDSPDTVRAFIKTPLPPDLLATISGNASPATKTAVARWHLIYTHQRMMFADTVGKRLKVVEVSIGGKKEDERKLEARVVFEIDVEEDMLNGGGTVHGACSVFFVDICTSLALSALSSSQGAGSGSGVSQSINCVFHSPASLGDKLKIVNTTLALGTRVMSAQTEIWNVTHHRLVASGVHSMMSPSSVNAKM